MKKMKLALLCDIDNAQISVDAFNAVTEKFGKDAEIVTGKLYGYSDRRHKGFSEVVNASCFEIAGTMRYKKRSSQMDVRILIDAVALAQESYIDGFVIVAGAGDFAPLLAYLKSKGKYVAGAFANPENALYCDETVELPEEAKEEKPEKAKVEKPAPAAKESVKAEESLKEEEVAPVPERAAVSERAPVLERAPEEKPAPEQVRTEEPAPAPEASAEEKSEASTADIFAELEKIVKEFASKK